MASHRRPSLRSRQVTRASTEWLTVVIISKWGTSICCGYWFFFIAAKLLNRAVRTFEIFDDMQTTSLTTGVMNLQLEKLQATQAIYKQKKELRANLNSFFMRNFCLKIQAKRSFSFRFVYSLKIILAICSGVSLQSRSSQSLQISLIPAPKKLAR